MSNRVRLESAAVPKLPAAKRKRIRLMLDSGAFSAWKSGTEVDFKAYMKWVRDNERWLFSYVNLDVLPGKLPGRPKLDPEQCAAASDRNLQTMLDARLDRTIPVFHQFENFKWLAKMVEDGHPYIGISSHSKIPLEQRIAWLNEVFTLLCDSKGRPCVRTHGFAMGSPELMYSYPFYTVDSTSWIATSAYGNISNPADNSPYNHAKISISLRKVRRTNHISLMGKDGRDKVAEYLQAVGIADFETAASSYILRARTSAAVARRIINARTADPCRFGSMPESPVGWTAWLPGMRPDMPPMQAVKPFKLKIFNVAWGNVMNYVLNELSWQDRLMSYLNISEWGEDELAQYVETGFPTGNYQYGGTN